MAQTQLTEFDAELKESDTGRVYVEVPPEVVAREEMSVGSTVQVAIATDAITSSGGVGRASATAPVSFGEFREVTVTDTGDEGDGIAYIEGFVVFVQDADVGDEVIVEIVYVEDDYAVAEVRGR